MFNLESLWVCEPLSFDGYRPGNLGGAFNGPVGAAQALRWSLNIPAVDLLDRVGPARFSARLDNAGISLKFPRGAKPNLSLILGGTGARLEDLVGAIGWLNRYGERSAGEECVSERRYRWRRETSKNKHERQDSRK